MTSPSPNKLSAITALKKIQSGALTSEELISSCLERIEERETTVGAWQFISPQQVLEEARKLEKSNNKGKLQGIPVGIKDIFNTSTMPTTFGSKIYQGYQPAADAACVAQIRSAGGIILGKTVTTEFAFFEPGKTANPINPEHTPGGSSSGSAAAVADFMVPWALGSQTVGSTIRPASFCGIIGYKPSFGLIDRTGVRPLAETFDTIGIFSRTVRDAAYLTSIMSRRPSVMISEKKDFSPKFALCKTPEWENADQDSRNALEKAANLIEAGKGFIKEISLPSPFDELTEAQSIITDFECANSAAYELTFHPEDVSDKYLERARAGLSYSEQEYDDALTIVRQTQKIIPSIFAGIDVILCPSAIGEAPKGLSATGNPLFNRIGTALKGPCLNVPGLTGHLNLPVGVQLIGEFQKDHKVLTSGQWLHDRLQAG